MNRKLRAIGFTIAAVMVAMAMSASAASAAEFHSEAAHTLISGSQVGEDVFTVNAGTVKCKKATYTGTQSTATSTSQSVVPAYSECTAFGFVNTVIDVENCIIEFTPTGTIHIRPAGPPPPPCRVIITAFNCWVTVEAQENLKTATYTTEGSGSSRDIKTSVEISGIKYTQTSKSFPGCTNGTFTNGSYKGAATVKGTNTAGEPVGIWFE